MLDLAQRTLINLSIGGARGFLHSVVREPFAHFLVLGAALFAVSHYLDGRSSKVCITLTANQVRRISEGYRMQYGGLPSRSELAELVNRYIDEEILYREALKLGLNQEDEVIRRRLVQKYEFLMQDLSAPAEPTEGQLRAYYAAHLNQYQLPERVTFSQVYFSPDRRGEQGAHRAAEQLAESLNRRGITRAAEDGDRFPGATDYAGLSSDELVRVFGNDGLAQQIFHVPAGHWSSPLRSGFGWHTVYVSGIDPSREASFDSVREAVRRDYLEAERNRRNSEAFAKLRAHYQVIRLP